MTRIWFIYLSGCFVCFQVRRKAAPQIPLSSDLLALFGDFVLLSISLAAHPLFPLLIFQRETGAAEASTHSLSCDSYMSIIIFITLYGIPLVVTKRHVSFEILEPNQSVFKFRG